MRAAFLIATIGLLSACLAQEPDHPAPTPSQAQCSETGGSLVVGLAGPQCAHPAPDAGKSCEENAQCSGFCLAKTKTCSPVAPYFGCHEVIPEKGMTAVICVD